MKIGIHPSVIARQRSNEAIPTHTVGQASRNLSLRALIYQGVAIPFHNI